MLSIKNLSVTYEDITAVNNFSFDFSSGKIAGLIGPNGAGKSSLLKACVGLIEGYEGNIYYDNKELDENRYWIKKNCGYAPEDAVLFPYLSGEEFLQLIASIRGTETNDYNDINFFTELTALNNKKNELIVNYSHGMRQKLAVAAALIGSPQFIILDESLNGFDPVALFRLKKHLIRLAQSGKTIILSSHILSLIREWCDPIVIMDKGALVKSFSGNELLRLEQKQSKTFEEIFINQISTP